MSNVKELGVSSAVYNIKDQTARNQIAAQGVTIANQQTQINGAMSTANQANQTASNLSGAVTANATAIAQLQGSARKYIMIGDSYGDGYSPDGSTTGWCDRVASYLGLTSGVNYWANHAGGAGFGRSDSLSFAALLDALTVPTDQQSAITDIVIGGGYNDYTWSIENINAGIDRVKTVVNTKYPNANVWVFAMGWTNSCQNRRALCYRYDEAYMRSCNANGWKYREIYPQLQYKYYFSSDYIHPNASGLYLLANCIAGALNGSDIADITHVISLEISGTSVGNACRVGKYIHVRLWGSSLQTNVIQAGGLSNTGQSITSPYIMGGTAAAEDTVSIPAVLQMSDGKFFNTTLTVSFRTQSDGSVLIYAQHNCVNADHSAYLGSNVAAIQLRGCSFDIPICDA